MDISERVRRYAADALGESCLGGITSVARFDAGDRHAVFRVTYVDAHGYTNDVVVRVSTRDDGAERVQAEREAVVLKKLQGVGAPRLYDYRNESRWFDTPAMCLQFIEGAQRELVSAPRKDVEALGAVVALVRPRGVLHAIVPEEAQDVLRRDGAVAICVGEGELLDAVDGADDEAGPGAASLVAWTAARIGGGHPPTWRGAHDRRPDDAGSSTGDAGRIGGNATGGAGNAGCGLVYCARLVPLA